MLTCLAILLDLPTGISNLPWMFGPALLIGPFWNRSHAAALTMTCVLLLTCLIVVSNVGNAMGGI